MFIEGGGPGERKDSARAETHLNSQQQQQKTKKKMSHKTPKKDQRMSQYMQFIPALSSIPASDAAFGFATRYRRRSPLPSADTAEPCRVCRMSGTCCLQCSID
jgi:hypothetical protein